MESYTWDEEPVTDEESAVEDVESVVDAEEVVAKPKGKEEVEEVTALAILKDQLLWLRALNELEKALKEEAQVRKNLSDVINDELLEIKREKRRSLWKIGWALKHIKGEVPLPEELREVAFKAFQGAEPPGAERPWLLLELMKKYKIKVR